MTETPEDSTTLRDPADLRLFIGRITDLTAQPCIATWMAVEVAAIAEFLYGGVITLNRVWQLLLPHFGMAPTVSSTPGPETDQRLVLPLRMRDIVWHDLSELHKGAVLPALPVLPAPGGRSTSGAAELMEDYLATLMRGLSLLHARGLSGESVLKRLEYGLANDIEQHLAAKWLSDPFVIGAALHDLALRDRNGVGAAEQSVYVLKTLVSALNREIDGFAGANRLLRDTDATRQARGQIMFWSMLLKGYLYVMLESSTVFNVPAAMLGHPVIIADIQRIVPQALNLTPDPSRSTPNWGGSSLSTLGAAIRDERFMDLLGKLARRLAVEQAKANLGEH